MSADIHHKFANILYSEQNAGSIFEIVAINMIEAIPHYFGFFFLRMCAIKSLEKFHTYGEYDSHHMKVAAVTKTSFVALIWIALHINKNENETARLPKIMPL